MKKIQIIDNSIHTEYEGTPYVFDCSELSKYFKDINEYDVEFIYADSTDKNLTIALTVASGQSGIIAVVDVTKNKIIHIQDGSFAISASVFGENVISLHYVSFWGQVPYYTINLMQCGNMDTSKESKSIKLSKDLDLDFSKYTISLSLNGNSLKISNGTKSYTEDISTLL